MARNAEKAQFMLNRFLASRESAQAEDGGTKKPTRRPRLAAECTDLYEAEGWRNQMLRDIGRKVMEIQNEGLGEERLRQLNDEINQLMRIKSHWEKRIVELGGPDHAKSGLRIAGLAKEADGLDGGMHQGRGSYRYYGAAKKLPGVKELFEVHARKQKKQTKGELMKKIDGDYYGFRDEDDGGAMVKKEAEAEVRLRAMALERQRDEWAKAGVAGVAGNPAVEESAVVHGAAFEAYVPLPDAAAIEATIVASKKARLLATYGDATR
jgi:pre-mRNA-splicing factor ISY1